MTIFGNHNPANSTEDDVQNGPRWLWPAPWFSAMEAISRATAMELKTDAGRN